MTYRGAIGSVNVSACVDACVGCVYGVDDGGREPGNGGDPGVGNGNGRVELGVVGVGEIGEYLVNNDDSLRCGGENVRSGMVYVCVCVCVCVCLSPSSESRQAYVQPGIETEWVGILFARSVTITHHWQLSSASI